MNILLMNQFFWPDSAATSQLLADLARELTARGHRVEVICGGSYAGTDAADAPDVTIRRVNGFRFSRGAAARVLSYASFYIGATWHALTMPRPDTVVTLTTPPLLSLIGALVHRLRGVRFYIWEMDMYPDVAVDLGYLRAGSLLHRITGHIADWSRLQADGIIALGECMRTRLESRGVAPSKISVVHNWADSRQVKVRSNQSSDSTLQLVYSGNLGLAHDLATINAAMLALREDARFRFTFIGGGSRRAELSAFVSEHAITNIAMGPYVPRSDLSETLGLGNIGLVTQRDECCGSVVPSKVYGLLAAGRPVLFIGPAEATPARIIQEHACGWHISCGDSQSLIELLLHLAEDPQEVLQAGKNARNALETVYDYSLGTSRIIAVLTGESLSDHNASSATHTLPVSLTAVQS